MIDRFFLFVYIITVGMTFSVTFLSMLYWLRKRVSGRFNTFLFIAYLAILLILAGVKFYWTELTGDSPGLLVTTSLAEFIGFGSLLYYIPATVNRIINRKWTRLRLSAAITACTVYIAIGTVYLFTGYLEGLALAAAIIYLSSLSVILIDILASSYRIKRFSTRLSVLLVTGLTVTFLPLVMVSRLLEGTEGPWAVTASIRFLVLCIYYFWMAITGLSFYMREMGVIVDDGRVKNELRDNLPLTRRELGIALFLARGMQYSEVAEHLGISSNTVRNHVSNIYKKLSIRSKIELTKILGEEEGVGIGGSGDLPGGPLSSG